MRFYKIFKIIAILLLSFLFGSATKAQQIIIKKNLALSCYSFRNDNLASNNFIRLNNLTSGLASYSDVNSSEPDIKIYSGFGNNIVNSFKGDNLYLHLAGIASTFLIIYTNTDYHVENFFNDHEGFGVTARPVIRLARYFPFIISGSLYAYGKLKPDNEAVGASFAVLQSSLIAFMYNSLLKALTGRPHPDWKNTDDMKSLSKTFRFGFMHGGIF
jgi:hypothetical protein